MNDGAKPAWQGEVRIAGRSDLHIRPAAPPAATKGKRKAKGKPVTLAGSSKIIEGERIVEDPYEPGARLKARVNLAEHPLELMLARGRMERAHYEAGVRFRAIYERAEIGGARGIDYGKLRVDGGTAPDPLSDATGQAHLELCRLAMDLGLIGFRLISEVCGRGVLVADLAKTWPGAEAERKKLDYLTMRLKEALQVLAVDVWGARGKVTGRITGDSGGAGRPDVTAVDDATQAGHIARFEKKRQARQLGG